MPSTKHLRAMGAFFAVLLLIPAGIRASEPEPFRKSVAEIMAGAALHEKGSGSAFHRLPPPSRQPRGVSADGLDSRGRFRAGGALRPAGARRQLPRRHARRHGRVSAGHLGRGGADAVSGRR